MMDLPVGKPCQICPVVQPTEPVKEPYNPGLTKSQYEVARLLIKGYDNHEIGRRLFVEKRTIEFHVCALMRAFDVPTRYKLICILYDTGWR